MLKFAIHLHKLNSATNETTSNMNAITEETFVFSRYKCILSHAHQVNVSTRLVSISASVSRAMPPPKDAKNRKNNLTTWIAEQKHQCELDPATFKYRSFWIQQ